MTSRHARRLLAQGALAAALLAGAPRARADRTILSPCGTVVSPAAVKLEGAFRAERSGDSLLWLALGLPQQDLGLEVEAEQTSFGGVHRTGLSAQYSLTGNLLLDTPAPVVSVGVRDLLRSGREGQSFYFVAGKSIPVGGTQPFISDLRLNVGYGSSRLGGGFASAEAKFRPGFVASVEYLNRRLNAQVALPLARFAQLRAYSLDGTVYYGAVVTLRK